MMTSGPHIPMLVCVFLAFQTVSIAQESPYPKLAPVAVADGFTLEKATLTERNIPALFLYKDEPTHTKKPVVFLLHGGGMADILLPRAQTTKESWFTPSYHDDDVPYTLAEGGVLVVLMDQWWAGERYKPEYRQIAKSNYLEAVVMGYTETTKDISLMIDALAERDDADTTRIGVTGRSGGAIVSLMCAASDPRITAVTSWVGGADLMGMAHVKLPERIVNHYLERSPNISELIGNFDPLHHLAKMPPTAILMINNRTDPAMPLASAETLYAKLMPFYEEIPDRLSLRILDTSEPTHAMTKQNYDDGCAWLIRHLVGTPDS